MPDVAIDALENDVDGLIFKIIDLRGYARAKEAYEEGKKTRDPMQRPKGAAIDRVKDMDFELAEEELARRLKQQ